LGAEKKTKMLQSQLKVPKAYVHHVPAVRQLLHGLMLYNYRLEETTDGAVFYLSVHDRQVLKEINENVKVLPFEARFICG
jgi:hypothetical protein